jgi:hypothetical protein
MLGYFQPLKDELKMKDYYDYRAFYCGHCHLLKNEFSRLSAAFMSYEAVFISLLFTTSTPRVKTKIRCTAFPLVKVPIFNTDIMDLSILVNQLFTYAKLQDKVFDDEWYGYRIINMFTNWGKNKTRRRLKTYNIDYDDVFAMLERGHHIEVENITFSEYIAPYQEAMEYIFSQIALYKDLDQSIYRSIGGDFLILMNLLDAGDDYFDDIKNKRFTPLNHLSEAELVTYFKNAIPEQLDKIVNNVFLLQHPYEVIILNILGEHIDSEKNRIIKKLRNKGESNHGSKPRLLRYLRSI